MHWIFGSSGWGLNATTRPDGEIRIKGQCAFEGCEVSILKPGDVFYVSNRPHDSWVIGNEQYVSLHFIGADKYIQ